MTYLSLRIPRERSLLRQTLARWGRYFWLPCPCCGEMTAGFEVGHRHITTNGRSHSCCRWCDSCAGADREQAALIAEVGEEVFETYPVVMLLRDTDTPREWRCRT